VGAGEIRIEAKSVLKLSLSLGLGLAVAELGKNAMTKYSVI
jgi:hypothetical protein